MSRAKSSPAPLRVRQAVAALVSALALTLAACSTPTQVAPPQLGESSSTSAPGKTTSGAATPGATTTASSAPVTPAVTPGTTGSSAATPTTGAESTSAKAVGLELPAPTNFDEASKRFNSSQPVKAAEFADSTGSVYCNFTVPENLVCQIAAGALPVPSAGFCADPATQVRAIAFKGAEMPELRCTPPNPLPATTVPKLKYGDSSETDTLKVNCLSESFGLICIDFETKHGFYISDIGYKTF